METKGQDPRLVSFEVLKKYGVRWAVLTALALDEAKRGVRVASDLNDALKVARMKIMSGCFSPCEVGCDLGKVEGQLVAGGSSLGEEYLRPWFKLLGQAMEGQIDPQHIADIPALQPIATDCQFLACKCGPHFPGTAL
jgi:hypothetical protein